MSQKLSSAAPSIASGKVPAPVKVKLKRVNCDQAIPYPPDGQTRKWWQRLMNALGTPQFEPAPASDELEDVGLRLSLPVTMNRARSGRFLPGLQLPSKLMAQDMFGSRRRVMLSFERQPFPGACHVDQDVPHS